MMAFASYFLIKAERIELDVIIKNDAALPSPTIIITVAIRKGKRPLTSSLLTFTPGGRSCIALAERSLHEI